MSRLITILVILLLIAGALYFLSSSAEPVPQTVIETDVATPGQAR